jgi:hypothetical protein
VCELTRFSIILCDAHLEYPAKAYLGAIREQENLRQSGSTYFLGMEKLALLQRFCVTGHSPEKQADILVKELLKYRLLDIVALVYGMASESNSEERGKVPFVDKIVHHFSL